MTLNKLMYAAAIVISCITCAVILVNNIYDKSDILLSDTNILRFLVFSIMLFVFSSEAKK